MKRLLALLVALILILGACAPEPEKDPLVGTWQARIPVDGAALGVSDFDGRLEVNLTLTFGADGKCTFALDEERLRGDLPGFEGALADYMLQRLYRQAGNQQAADAAMEQSVGMTCAEYVAQLVADMDLEGMLLGSLAKTNATEDYRIESDRLIIAEKAVAYTLQGDSLKLSGDVLGQGLALLGLTELELTRIG